jgi:hypothetical protein
MLDAVPQRARWRPSLPLIAVSKRLYSPVRSSQTGENWTDALAQIVAGGSYY